MRILTTLPYFRLILLAFASFTWISCQTDYQKMEAEGIASGKIENELFLGLELGMPQRTFYEKCWEMNSQGILTNGPTELSVEYQVEMPSSLPTKMRFYPKFKEDKIYLMPVDYSYDGWAPWNENLSVENLRKDVLRLYENWYGPGFIEVKSQDGNQIVFVKIDGTRRTRIFKKNLSTVRVEISDLRVLRGSEENTE